MVLWLQARAAAPAMTSFGGLTPGSWVWVAVADTGVAGAFSVLLDFLLVTVDMAPSVRSFLFFFLVLSRLVVYCACCKKNRQIKCKSEVGPRPVQLETLFSERW